MMTLLVTFLIGLSSVVQAGLNRQMGEYWGLPSTVFLNALMFLLAAAAYFVCAKFQWVPFPDALAEKAGFQNTVWWYLIPGLLGFVFVIGVPFAIAKIGAVQVFVGLVLAQMVGGLLWDQFVEGLPMTWTRVAGAGLAVAAMVLASQ